MIKRDKKTRYGTAYVREAARKHEQKVRDGVPVYMQLARRKWR